MALHSPLTHEQQELLNLLRTPYANILAKWDATVDRLLDATPEVRRQLWELLLRTGIEVPQRKQEPCADKPLYDEGDYDMCTNIVDELAAKNEIEFTAPLSGTLELAQAADRIATQFEFVQQYGRCVQTQFFFRVLTDRGCVPYIGDLGPTTPPERPDAEPYMQYLLGNPDLYARMWRFLRDNFNDIGVLTKGVEQFLVQGTDERHPHAVLGFAFSVLSQLMTLALRRRSIILAMPFINGGEKRSDTDLDAFLNTPPDPKKDN